MKRLLLTIALLAGWVGSAHAQNFGVDDYILTAGRDLDATSFEYCRTVGLNGSMVDRAIAIRPKLAATASSTTVTGTNAFANVAVGDVLLINVAGAVKYRSVRARASADSITIDSILSTAALTNLQAQYRKGQCGAADTSGAFPVAGAHRFSIQLNMAQFVGTSFDFDVECRIQGPEQAWTPVVASTNKVAVFNGFILDTEAVYDECRVGVKINTDDGDDLTTNAERLTILVSKRF